MRGTQHLIDFASLDRLFHQLGLGFDPAECHGSLCGLLCASDAVTGPVWVNRVLVGDPELPVVDSLSARGMGAEANYAPTALLFSLYKDTVEDLNDPEYGFSLLLPDDDEPLPQRVEELSRWCQGFLFGLGLGGVREQTNLSGETREVMRDFVEISRLGTGEASDSNEDEAAFAEIVEYVRMAVLLLYEELRSLRTVRPDGAPVH
jgi:uncharacterized protein YgfB (UPF0149 family)